MLDAESDGKHKNAARPPDLINRKGHRDRKTSSKRHEEIYNITEMKNYDKDKIKRLKETENKTK